MYSLASGHPAGRLRRGVLVLRMLPGTVLFCAYVGIFAVGTIAALCIVVIQEGLFVGMLALFAVIAAVIILLGRPLNQQMHGGMLVVIRLALILSQLILPHPVVTFSY